jgi:uncharacterized protein YgbK (DUF1537 family)
VLPTSHRLIFGAVADDDTGASDLAGMLAERGLRTLLIIDLPAPREMLAWSDGYDAVVMAEGTRNLAPATAAERTRRAIQLLQLREPRQFQIKYCSTFDSTAEGNIGPSIEAALVELGEVFTIALPALPVNGRTTYLGHHFVHQQLLSDSPMRDHPLTPMTNSNLVTHLGTQTSRKVGLATYSVVEAGSTALASHLRELRAQGVGVAIIDCLNERHVQTICGTAADLKLVTGGSALGIGLPNVWRERGWLLDQDLDRDEDLRIKPIESIGARLIVAGSCSIATRGQNDWFAQNRMALQIDPRDLLAGSKSLLSVIELASGELSAGRDCLLTTSADPTRVSAMQEWCKGRDMDVPAAGEAIANALADLVAELLRRQPISGLISAGGETSGALCRRLGLGALHVGRNIEPGIPLCFALGRYRMPVALKSGNFGGVDFYGNALKAMEHADQYLNCRIKSRI